MAKHLKSAPKTFRYGGRNFKKLVKLNSISRSFLNLECCEYGLKALEYGKLNKNHLETLFRLFKKVFSKSVVIKSNMSLLYSFTKKPSETRMGKGKGARQYWECLIMPGMILFEFGEITEDDLLKSFDVISNLLPLKVKLVKLVY